MRYIAPIRLSPTSYGGLPASAWNNVVPNDQTSLDCVADRPDATSGARYAGDPVTRPVRVSVRSATARAIPKSDSFTSPSSPTRMLDGLTSRWTTVAAWAAASASATLARIGAAASGVSGPPSAIICARFVPATYSMISQWPSGVSTKSKTATTFGWLTRAARRASRSARTMSASTDPGGIPTRLSATARPSTSSRPSQTAPEPPRPIWRSSVYLSPTRPLLIASVSLPSRTGWALPRAMGQACAVRLNPKQEGTSCLSTPRSSTTWSGAA